MERFYGIQYVKKIPVTYYEVPITTKQGEIIWIGQHIQLVTEDHEIKGFQAIGRDVTARRRAEEALKESEKKYRALIESLPHAVAIFQDHRLAFINSAGIRMFGWNSLDDALGTEALSLVSPQERDRISGYTRERNAGSSDVPGQYLTTLQGLDGKEFPAQVSVTLVDYEGRSAEQLLISDLTEQQEAERALVESELNYRTLFQESRDAVVITSRGGRLIDANQAFMEMFGFAEEEIRDMDILTVYPNPILFSPPKQWEEVPAWDSQLSVEFRNSTAHTLSARVNPGQGTTFRICFPSSDQDMRAPGTTAEPTKFPRGLETVLLVDDEDFVRDFGERILRRYGYNFLIAKNGKEALELYRKEKDNISLVILDLIMPEMGGKQCMKELLKINPAVKVLVASGYESGGGRLDASQAGAAGFVRKPFNVSQILQSVRQIIDS